MHRTLIFTILTAICLLMISSTEHKTTIFMVGDSTMADKDISTGSPERGWGMVLQGCFSDDIIVENHAKNGRSSISFINEGLWQKVLERIKPGDYVFIQFGHNDEKHDQPGKTRRFAKPGSSFDDNLTRYVNETRERGGIPVLFNSVERRLFFDARKAESTKRDSLANSKTAKADDETLRDVEYGDEEVNTLYLVPTHYTLDGDYTAVPRIVAKKTGTPFVDATTISHNMEQDHGVVGSRKLHMWLKPGEIASIPKGRRDNTHYSIYGAHVIANLLADAIGDAVPALKPYVRHYDYVVSAEGRGNYMTVEEAIADIPQGNKATILILDGKHKRPSTGKNIRYEVREGAELTK